MVKKNQKTCKEHAKDSGKHELPADVASNEPQFNPDLQNKSTACSISPKMSEEKAFKLKEAERNAILQLEQCYRVICELASLRLTCKLSNNRVTGVARELNELRKVMSVYIS